MSRQSRDGHHSHERDDDEVRSHHSARQNDQDDQDEEQSQDASDDSQHSEREHSQHKDHSDGRSDEEHERRDHEGSNGRSHGHSRDNADDDEPVADHSKFASYDDDEAERDEVEPSRDDDGQRTRRKSEGRYYWDRQPQRSHRVEPAHRPHSDFRAPPLRETAMESGPVAHQTTATRQAADPVPSVAASPASSSAASPSTSTDPLPIYGRAALHPYDNNRAVLIGISTALVAAIAVIVALMFNLSVHKDLAQSAQKDRKLYQDRWTSAQSDAAAAQALAEQRTREAQLAAEQYAQSQRQIQTQQQAYVATQTQLRQTQVVQVQAQAENQRRTYVTQIRLAKQAWDRGDTNEVLRLLQPYEADPNQQKLCTFAWYYLWRAAHNSGSIALRGHTDVVRQVVVTPDGSQIMTFGDDGQLIAWDAASGRRLGGMALERNVPPKSSGLIVEDQLAHRAAGLVVARNGAWAAAYGRDLFVGTNIRQPDAVRPVSDHQSPIISLAISGDGQRLASGDYSGEILIRDAADGRVLRRFHNPRPQAMVLSSDGGIVFAGMHDGGLFVWDVNKGTLLGTRAFGDGINSMALSPDASTLALALGVRDGVVRLWEPGTGRFHGDLRGHHDEVLRVVWSNDGKSLLTASRDQTADLWSSQAHCCGPSAVIWAMSRPRLSRPTGRKSFPPATTNRRSFGTSMADSPATCSTTRPWTAGSAGWPLRPMASRLSAAVPVTGQGTVSRPISPPGTWPIATVLRRCRPRRGRVWPWPSRPTAGRWSWAKARRRNRR